MNYMDSLRRINQQFDKGVLHGIKNIYKPGLTFGSFRRAYLSGYKEGGKMRKLTDFKRK